MYWITCGGQVETELRMIVHLSRAVADHPLTYTYNVKMVLTLCVVCVTVLCAHYMESLTVILFMTADQFVVFLDF